MSEISNEEVPAGGPRRGRVGLDAAEQDLVRRRRTIGRLLQIPLHLVVRFLLRFVAGYRLEAAAAIRRRFREIAAEPGPILICANHLTYIDSAIIIWALGSTGWYAAHPSRLSWNVPAQDVFGRHPVYRFVGVISKCIFVDRQGNSQHKDAVKRICSHLLGAGEVVTIFPEGRRSRSGRFEAENLTAGAGRLLAENPGCRVLCVYLRGDRQVGFSNFPPRGSRFHMDLDLLSPQTETRGRQGYRDLVQQIGATIAQREARFLARNGGTDDVVR